MKNQTIKSGLVAGLLALLLTACTPTGLHQFPVHTLNAGKVTFSNIKADKHAQGMMVTGNVKRRSQAGKRVPIPGHIHIILKSINGNELETIKARTHRKYGNSKLWHFDGLLKMVPPEGSAIVVMYHNRHPE